MDPSGPAQPALNTAYTTAGNPVDQNPQEQQNADSNVKSNAGSLLETREQGDINVPSRHDDGPTPSSLGYGARDTKGDAGSRVRIKSRASVVVSLS